MNVVYSPAPQVAALAAGLIEAHHPHLAEVLGKARLVTGLSAFLPALAAGELKPHYGWGHDFFCMEIAGFEWMTLTDEARMALVDHELCHMGVEVDEESGAPFLVLYGHDVEEFIVVASRHGAWSPGLGALVDACAVPR